MTSGRSMDIRDKPFIEPGDVTALPFVRSGCPYVFRRHYRQGLRSHILEVHDPARNAMESRGVWSEGVRFYPGAAPLGMLRIFRIKFTSFPAALREIENYRIIERYLPPESYAASNEFLVSYSPEGKTDMLLCGLQEYVEGCAFDPWRLAEEAYLRETALRLADSRREKASLLMSAMRESARQWVARVKRMILSARKIPDLAGAGNLILTPDGAIKLVDINNISDVSFAREIRLDDKRYPVCDKSIEAIHLMERHLAGGDIDRDDPVYKVFRDPGRLKEVSRLEAAFAAAVR